MSCGKWGSQSQNARLCSYVLFPLAAPASSLSKPPPLWQCAKDATSPRKVLSRKIINRARTKQPLARATHLSEYWGVTHGLSVCLRAHIRKEMRWIVFVWETFNTFPIRKAANIMARRREWAVSTARNNKEKIKTGSNEWLCRRVRGTEGAVYFPHRNIRCGSFPSSLSSFPNPL